jgi:hypothetical protein
MKYRATETFWRKFYRLAAFQKANTRAAWAIFKENPFDPRLGAHKINNLSAHYKKTIYSVVIENDLRVLFYIEDDAVWTVDIGTHAVYQ